MRWPEVADSLKQRRLLRIFYCGFHLSIVESRDDVISLGELLCAADNDVGFFRILVTVTNGTSRTSNTLYLLI
jgi:hypothetical protein